MKKKATKKPAFGGFVLNFTNANATLEEVFGKKSISPAQMTKGIWKYIKKNKLARKKVGRKEEVVKWK